MYNKVVNVRGSALIKVTVNIYDYNLQIPMPWILILKITLYLARNNRIISLLYKYRIEIEILHLQLFPFTIKTMSVKHFTSSYITIWNIK